MSISSRAQILEDCELADKANVKANTLTLLDRKRLELARALATRPRLLLLDEVAGGLSEIECETLVALIRRIRLTGVSVIWIEHIVHALLAIVDRIVVLAGGSLHRRRSAGGGDQPSEGHGNLHGHPGRRMTRA